MIEPTREREREREMGWWWLSDLPPISNIDETKTKVVALGFTRSFTFSHFRSVTEADVLRYIRETRKNMLFTRSYQSIKAWWSIWICRSCCGSFDEGHFVATEKHGLIRPYLKKIGLDINDFSNYCPVTNMTHLSKITERAMLDQLVPFLEEVGVVPRYQSAYRKLHSTETALCKIHDDLVSNTCHGKASILVLYLSTAFDTVDHQVYSWVIFPTVESRALHCLCLNLTLKTGNSVWL